MSNDVFSKLEKPQGADKPTDALEQVNKEEKRRKVKFAVAGASLAVVTVATTLFFVFDGDDAISAKLGNDDTPISAKVGGGNNTVQGGDVDSRSDLDKSDTGIAADVPSWSTTPLEGRNIGDIRNNVWDTYRQTGLTNAAIELPSESAGYHMGGEMDDMQAVLTREEFIAASGEYIERLINPTFGGWTQAQYPSGEAFSKFPVDKFYDMFSARYLDQHRGQAPGEYFPAYADWNGDNYGMSNLSPVSRWHGVVKNIDADVSDFNTTSESMTISADVVFSSWDNDGGKIEKNGKLTLSLVPGVKGERPVVIENANLSVF